MAVLLDMVQLFMVLICCNRSYRNVDMAKELSDFGLYRVNHDAGISRCGSSGLSLSR